MGGRRALGPGGHRGWGVGSGGVPSGPRWNERLGHAPGVRLAGPARPMASRSPHGLGPRPRDADSGPGCAPVARSLRAVKAPCVPLNRHFRRRPRPPRTRLTRRCHGRSGCPMPHGSTIGTAHGVEPCGDGGRGAIDRAPAQRARAEKAGGHARPAHPPGGSQRGEDLCGHLRGDRLPRHGRAVVVEQLEARQRGRQPDGRCARCRSRGAVWRGGRAGFR
jgi:hypothetical protein